MDIGVEMSGTDSERVAHVVDETVEVVDGVGLRGGTEAAASLMSGEQQLIVTHPQEVLVPTSEVQIETQAIDVSSIATMHSSPMITIPVGPPSPGSLGNKRSHTQAELAASATELLQSTGSPILAAAGMDLPRKKSRNYLDSHKTIEKKRRVINTNYQPTQFTSWIPFA